MTIKSLIEDEHECDFLDFKAESYRKENHDSLIKDIMAMANSHNQIDKYIITGIKDCKGERNINGINTNDTLDDADYHQLILENIEPEINFKFSIISYEGKKLGVFHIFNNNNRPYILKKQFGKLRKGLCQIRKGSQQSEATRSDFDRMYDRKGCFEVRIIEPFFHATKNEIGCATLRVAIRNLTDDPMTIIHGSLFIKNTEGLDVSCHQVFGLDDDYVGADFTLNMPPKNEKVGYLLLAFESSDSLRLGLNSYGYPSERFSFKLILTDSLGNEYMAVMDEGRVFARGRFLWKVQSREEVMERQKKSKKLLGLFNRGSS